RHLAEKSRPFLKGVLEAHNCSVTYLPGGKIANSDLRRADALLVRTRTKCDRALLEHTPVKFIATATIGFDHLDTEYLAQHGIVWCNAPGCNADSVTQYFCSAVLNYAAENHLTLRGKKLGIVGVGNVGRKIAAAGRALGLELLLNDPPRQQAEGGSNWVSLKELLHESDIISFHTPLNQGGQFNTFHLLNGENMALLKPSALLINSSRGEVTDNTALLAILNAGKISGAILDVWEQEPTINRDLLGTLFFATPHIAGYSADGKRNGTSWSVKKLAEFFHLPPFEFAATGFPTPADDLVDMSGMNQLSEAEQLAYAVNCAYDIHSDDLALRRSPGSFEQLRGNYPVRLEFNHYRVANAAPEINNILKELGFSV
ncbi:MAG: 4-phosphoerythronate dehydrogenase, partial [Victivallaceae bacterium]